jgi:hypothetical protein
MERGFTTEDNLGYKNLILKYWGEKNPQKNMQPVT